MSIEWIKYLSIITCDSLSDIISTDQYEWLTQTRIHSWELELEIPDVTQQILLIKQLESINRSQMYVGNKCM